MWGCLKGGREGVNDVIKEEKRKGRKVKVGKQYLRTLVI